MDHYMNLVRVLHILRAAFPLLKPDCLQHHVAMGRTCVVCDKPYNGSSRNSLSASDVEGLRAMGYSCEGRAGAKQFYAHANCVTRALHSLPAKAPTRLTGASSPAKPSRAVFATAPSMPAPPAPAPKPLALESLPPAVLATASSPAKPSHAALAEAILQSILPHVSAAGADDTCKKRPLSPTGKDPRGKASRLDAAWVGLQDLLASMQREAGNDYARQADLLESCGAAARWAARSREALEGIPPPLVAAVLMGLGLALRSSVPENGVDVQLCAKDAWRAAGLKDFELVSKYTHRFLERM